MYSDRPGQVRVSFYMNEREYGLLEEKIKQSGVNRSAYLRQVALSGSILVYDMKAINELIYEINKIGVNINQIARKVNEFETIHRNDVKKLNQEYEELCRMLNQFLFEQPLIEV